MAKPYPPELRIKIVEEYYAGGISQRNIAKKYNVSKTWVFRLLRKEKLRRLEIAEIERRSLRHLHIVRSNSSSQHT